MSRQSKGFGNFGPGMGTVLSLAFEFVAAVALFWLIGRWLDGLWGTDPWLQVSGLVLGWVGGVLHIYYAAERLGGAEEGSKQQNRSSKEG